MARMHARRRGKSGSHKPVNPEIPNWQGLGRKEVEEMVVKLAKEGHSTAMIGMILRDSHAVPSIRNTTGKRVNQILKDGGVQQKIPEDLQNLIKKAIRLDEHLKEKPKDLHNKRSLALVESRIRRLTKYHKSEGNLPQEWRYRLDSARLLIE
jgi:small subunit ribosomal protein S15